MDKAPLKKMLVFDDPEVVSLVLGAVEGRCEIVWAHKDEDLIPAVQKENPDLVLMKYEVDECARYGKLLEGVRSLDPKISIVIMGGEELLTHMPLNIKGAIFKPLHPDFLARQLKDFKILSQPD
ncbi:MAG TPA: hypothetical protein PLO78_05355 [Candidatus Omnitrophota bacterium]|nr:hypothetical protein [Candidatus Omnitrophota bacterium]